jgi:hypothetical protein
MWDVAMIREGIQARARSSLIAILQVRRFKCVFARDCSAAVNMYMHYKISNGCNLECFC